MSHSRDGPSVMAPLQTNIVPLIGVWNPLPSVTPPLKGPPLEEPSVRVGDSRFWVKITACQRVQIMKKDPKKIGILQFGTEVLLWQQMQ